MNLHRLVPRLARTPYSLGLALFLFFALAGGQAIADSIGTIDKLSGQVTITSVNGQSRQAQQGESIEEGDTVVSGADGEALFKMVDDGGIAIRPNSEMKFTKYEFKQKRSDNFLIELAKGSLRALTGVIGKSRPKKSLIKTPAATVGIRGTDHEVLHLLEDQGENKAGTYNRVYDGGTYIESKDGRKVDVSPNQVAFTPVDALALASQFGLLKGVPPALFTPGKYDSVLELMGEVLRQKLQEKVNEKLRMGPLQFNVPGLSNIFGGGSKDEE